MASKIYSFIYVDIYNRSENELEEKFQEIIDNERAYGSELEGAKDNLSFTYKVIETKGKQRTFEIKVKF